MIADAVRFEQVARDGFHIVAADAIKFEQVPRDGFHIVAADAVKFTTNSAEAASVFYVHPSRLSLPRA